MPSHDDDDDVGATPVASAMDVDSLDVAEFSSSNSIVQDRFPVVPSKSKKKKNTRT
jgi:hypothetical protein